MIGAPIRYHLRRSHETGEVALYLCTVLFESHGTNVTGPRVGPITTEFRCFESRVCGRLFSPLAGRFSNIDNCSTQSSHPCARIRPAPRLVDAQ